jgi:hypothetical protein
VLAEKFFSHHIDYKLTGKGVPSLENDEMLEKLHRELYGYVTILHVVHQGIYTLPIGLVCVDE